MNRPLNYGSVCSGIEAASTAWEPLGWKAAWFAEIEPFPSAALAHHWPEVPNLGDFTKIRNRIEAWESPAPEVLVGGTPCQAFSVAGLRQSMDDARGQLTLEFVRLANAIDTARSLLGIPECIIVWENVPGVLNTPDNAFGCFLAGLAGEDDPLLPPGGRWTNVGRVLGPSRAVAWRILDAQYFGVAQRCRRVFVVASARNGFDPTEILFEFDGVRRDSPPRRETGQGFASVAGALAANGGGLTRPAGNCNELDFCVPVAEVAATLRSGSTSPASHGKLNGTDRAELVVQVFAEVSPTLKRDYGKGYGDGERDPGGLIAGLPSASGLLDFESEALVATGFHGDVARTLTARHDSSPCADRGMDVVAIGFNARQDPDSWDGRTGPLDTDGGTQAVACFKGGQGSKAGGIGYSEHVAPTLSACPSGTQLAPTLMQGMQVRRLTPTECERLQGFPDGHTRIPWRGKPAEECPDGPRYKALGNSMAVPVMRWIGERISRFLV